MSRSNRLAAALTVALVLPVWAHEGHDHAATEHGHKAPHGGQVVSAHPYHVELVTQPNRFQVYLLDDHLKPVSTTGRKGEALLQFGGKTRKLTLHAIGNRFEGDLDLAKVGSYVAVVSMTVDGKLVRGRFASKGEARH